MSDKPKLKACPHCGKKGQKWRNEALQLRNSVKQLGLVKTKAVALANKERERADRLEYELDKSRASHTSRITELEAHRDTLLNDNEKLAIEAGNYRVRIGELEAEIAELKQWMERLKNEVEYGRTKFAAAIEQRAQLLEHAERLANWAREVIATEMRCYGSLASDGKRKNPQSIMIEELSKALAAWDEYKAGK